MSVLMLFCCCFYCVSSLFIISLISDAAQVYTCLINLEGGKNTKLILCCLSKRTEGLDLFIPELDNYVGRVKSQLQKLSVSQ